VEEGNRHAARTAAPEVNLQAPAIALPVTALEGIAAVETAWATEVCRPEVAREAEVHSAAALAA
jgi:hypothetical protein